MSNVTECGKATQRLLVLCCLLLLVAPAIKTSAQAVATPTRPLVEIRTELGTLVVALYNETPQHRDNFLKLVREHAYDSLLFHRVIADLMVQGGDPDSKRAAPGAPLGGSGSGAPVGPLPRSSPSSGPPGIPGSASGPPRRMPDLTSPTLKTRDRTPPA